MDFCTQRLFLLLLALFTLIQDGQPMLTKYVHMFAVPGERVIMPCDVDRLHKNIIWFRNGVPIFSNPITLTLEPTVGVFLTSNLSLAVDATEEHMNQRFFCGREANNGSMEYTNAYWLKPKSAPSRQRRLTGAVQRKTFNLMCPSDPRHRDSETMKAFWVFHPWFTEKVEKPARRSFYGYLILNGLKRHDSGVYECRVSGVGLPFQELVVVKVQIPGKPSIQYLSA
jgi:hypothetical protein